MKMLLKMGGAKTAKQSSAVNPTNALVMTDGVLNDAERIAAASKPIVATRSLLESA